MRGTLAFVIALYVGLRFPRLVDEVGRLVHVIPNARHPIVSAGAMQVSPPSASFRQGVVGVYAVARPHFAHVHGPIFALLKKLLSHALVKNVVRLVLWGQLWMRLRIVSPTLRRLILHPWIDDGHHLHALL